MEMATFFGLSVAGAYLAHELHQYYKKRSFAAERDAWNHGGSHTVNHPRSVTGPSLIGSEHLNPFQNPIQNPSLPKEVKIISGRKTLKIDENVANIAVCGNSGTGKCL